MSDEDDEIVGYGRPPKAHRFKPGTSGNPRGRPKARKNIEALARDLLGSTVTVRINGQSKKLTTIDAVFERLRADALRGDPRSVDRLLKMAERFEANQHDQENDNDLDFNLLSDRALDLFHLLRAQLDGDPDLDKNLRCAFIQKFGRQSAFWLFDPDDPDYDPTPIK